MHYVRDVTLGEDACQTHVGNAPRVLAALRDAILNLFRACGWENIGDAVRQHRDLAPRLDEARRRLEALQLPVASVADTLAAANLDLLFRRWV